MCIRDSFQTEFGDERLESDEETAGLGDPLPSRAADDSQATLGPAVAIGPAGATDELDKTDTAHTANTAETADTADAVDAADARRAAHAAHASATPPASDPEHGPR